jgi:hypothetical protein
MYMLRYIVYPFAGSSSLFIFFADNRDMLTTGMRDRRDSCASSAFGSSCLSAASSMCSDHRDPCSVPNNVSSSLAASSPYEYDIASTQSSESVDVRLQSSAPRYYGGTRLASSIASEGDTSSCRYSGRGGVSRFLAARRRESSDSGLPTDSSDFRRASEPVLNNSAAAPDPSSPCQRCHSAGGVTVPATLRRANRVPASLCSSRPSLMSSRSSIVTNASGVSDDPSDMKHTPDVLSPASVPASHSESVSSPGAPSTIADSVVGDLIIPDEMRDFINATYSNTRDTSAAADSTVADSPAAVSHNVESSPSVDIKTDNEPRSSCMYGSSPLGPTKQTDSRSSSGCAELACDNASVRPDQPYATQWSVPTHPPPGSDARSIYRSPSDGGHQIQVSQVSQSLRPERGQYSTVRPAGQSVSNAPRSLQPTFNSQQAPSYGSFDEAAVRYRRNPHQMNWWARNYGYYQQQMQGAAMYRLNADLTSGGRVMVHSAAPAMQMSPSCNQVRTSDCAPRCYRRLDLTADTC